jgi:hypothetical protein
MDWASGELTTFAVKKKAARTSLAASAYLENLLAMSTSWSVGSNLTRHSLIPIDVLLVLAQVILRLTSLPLLFLRGGRVAVLHVVVQGGFVLR